MFKLRFVEISYLPFSAQITCSGCDRLLDSSQALVHSRFCPNPNGPVKYKYTSEWKTKIDEKLEKRTRYLTILRDFLLKIEDVQETHNNLKELIQDIDENLNLSKCLQFNQYFSELEVKTIENKVLVKKIIINFNSEMIEKGLIKEILTWEIPQIRETSLYLKFNDYILNKRPILNNLVFGEFHLKYNDFLILKFEDFMGIYSIQLRDYLKFIYFVPERIFCLKYFKHLIYFRGYTLVYWNIDEEYEEFTVGLKESLKLKKITDDYRYAVFHSFNKLEFYDLEKREWHLINFPLHFFIKRKNNNVFRTNSIFDEILFSDDLELFINNECIWNKKENYLIDNQLFDNQLKRGFISNNYQYITIENDKIIIKDLNNSTYIKQICIGSIPLISSDKNFIQGLNLFESNSINYNSTLCLKTLKYYINPSIDINNLPNLSIDCEKTNPEHFFIRALGSLNKRYLENRYTAYLFTCDKFTVNIYGVNPRTNKYFSYPKKTLHIEIRKDNQIIKKVLICSKISKFSISYNNRYLMFHTGKKVKYWNIELEKFEFFTKELIPNGIQNITANDRSMKYYIIGNKTFKYFYIFKIFSIDNPSAKINSKPFYNKYRDSIFFIKNLQLHEMSIHSMIPIKLVDLKISSQQDCNFILLSPSYICVLVNGLIIIYNCDESKLFYNYSLEGKKEKWLDYKFIEKQEIPDLIIVLTESIYCFSLSGDVRKLSYNPNSKYIKTLLFDQNFLYITILVDISKICANVREIKINLDSLEISEEIGYYIDNKQTQVNLKMINFDISYLYLKSKIPRTEICSHMNFNFIKLLKNNFCVQILFNSVMVDLLSEGTCFELRVDGLDPNQWSTHNIYMIENYLFIGNDFTNDYYFYDLNLRKKISSTNDYNRGRDLVNSGLTKKVVYFKYFENYRLFIGKVVDDYRSMDNYFFFQNADILNHFMSNLQIHELFVSEKGRFIIGDTNHGLTMILDAKTNKKAYVKHFKAEKVIYASENDEYIFVKYKNVISRFKFEELLL